MSLLVVGVDSTTEDGLSVTLVETGIWGSGHEVKSGANGEKAGKDNDTHDRVSLEKEKIIMSGSEKIIIKRRKANHNLVLTPASPNQTSLVVFGL